MGKTWPGAAYVVARIGDTVRDEWTNVGVILYDRNGNQLAAKMVENLDRVVQRGDLPSKCGWMQHVEHLPLRLPNLDLVYKALASTGHMMVKLQITEPRPIILDVDISPADIERELNSLYEIFVA